MLLCALLAPGPDFMAAAGSLPPSAPSAPVAKMPGIPAASPQPDVNAATPALTTVSANTFQAFGPKTYIRQKGAPVVVTDNFSVSNTSIHYSLRVWNSRVADADKGDKKEGDKHEGDEKEQMSLASIALNGVPVVEPSQFGHDDPSVLQIAVPLLSSNTLTVKVLGPAGGAISVQIIGGMAVSYTHLTLPTIYSV